MISLLGDSMLNGIFEEGMQKHHNVKLNRHPGATTTDLVDYVKPVIPKKPDCFIVHKGSNDLTNREGVNTIQNLKLIIEEAKQLSPHTTMALSTVVLRRDQKAKKLKVSVPISEQGYQRTS